MTWFETVEVSGASTRVMSALSASPFNFARVKVRGIDYEASYRVPLDNIFNGSSSNLTLRGTATNYLENTVDNGISVPVDTVGQNSGQSSTPDWIFRMSATFDTPTYSVTAVGRGVSSGTYNNTYIVCTTNCPTSTATNPTINSNHIDGTFYTDLNFTAKINVGGAAGRQPVGRRVRKHCGDAGDRVLEGGETGRAGQHPDGEEEAGEDDQPLGPRPP